VILDVISVKIHSSPNINEKNKNYWCDGKLGQGVYVMFQNWLLDPMSRMIKRKYI